MHTRLFCSATGESVAIDRLQNLSPAGQPLMVDYDLETIRETFTPDAARWRPLRSLWRFWDVLPVDHPGDAVSLGEGCTPFLRCEPKGSFAAFERLYIKDEAFNPTGSFKARGMSVAITRARALGATVVALPSAGNAAGAATSYAARAGLECVLFMPEDTPPANIVESVAGGARVFLVNGLIGDCGKLVREGAERFGWFDLSTLKEPFRIEGKKTMGYELAFDLADAEGTGDLLIPDVILYPTGGGTGLIGMWKAFRELRTLGWLKSDVMPRMIAVQSDGCAPIPRAFDAGWRFATPWENARTCAGGLRVPAAVGDFMILDAIRESGGLAVAVPELQIIPAMRRAIALEGVSLCPETAACLVALERLIAEGAIRRDEKIVLFNTGAATKYLETVPLDLPVIPDPNAVDYEALSGRVG